MTWDLSYNSMMSCKMGDDGLQYTWLTYCNIQTAIMAFNTRAVLLSASSPIWANLINTLCPQLACFNATYMNMCVLNVQRMCYNSILCWMNIYEHTGMLNYRAWAHHCVARLVLLLATTVCKYLQLLYSIASVCSYI